LPLPCAGHRDRAPAAESRFGSFGLIRLPLLSHLGSGGFPLDRWQPVLLGLATAEPETHKAGGPNDRGRLVAQTADLVKLFGPPYGAMTVRRRAAADVSTVDTLPTDQPASRPVPAEPEHGPAWGKAGAELSGAVLQVSKPPGPVWDAKGYRISLPHRSVFPRQEPYRGGTHWNP
jgi:hypothetical protein